MKIEKLETRPINITWLLVMNFIMIGWFVFSLWKPEHIPAFTTQMAMVGVTVAIAVSTAVAAWVQFQQHEMHKEHHVHEIKIANVNHQFALYEKRLDAYKALDDFLLSCIQHGRVVDDERRKFNSRIEYLLFLIPDEQQGFINELRVKSNDAYRFHRLWARLIEKGNLTEQENERLESALENMHENEEWLFDQWEKGTLRREFEPLLKIPNEII